MQCRLIAIQPAQIAHQGLHTAMPFDAEQTPVEFPARTPLTSLGKLVAHEPELLAAGNELIGQQQAHICEFLPGIPRHFAEQ